MKKHRIFIILVVMIISFIVLDFINSKYNNTRPLIAIKTENAERQMIIYNAFLYRTIECTAEENNYLIIGYWDKIEDNLCPKKYNIKFENGYFTNKNNVRMEEELFLKLQDFYSYDDINNMTETQLEEAIKQINKYIPVTNKN